LDIEEQTRLSSIYKRTRSLKARENYNPVTIQRIYSRGVLYSLRMQTNLMHTDLTRGSARDLTLSINGKKGKLRENSGDISTWGGFKSHLRTITEHAAINEILTRYVAYLLSEKSLKPTTVKRKVKTRAQKGCGGHLHMAVRGRANRGYCQQQWITIV